MSEHDVEDAIGLSRPNGDSLPEQRLRDPEVSTFEADATVVVDLPDGVFSSIIEGLDD